GTTDRAAPPRVRRDRGSEPGVRPVRPRAVSAQRDPRTRTWISRARMNPAAPSLRGELRYGLEFARLAADREFLAPKRRPNSPPVLLVPGFMASDQSLSVLNGWLRRRGSPTAAAGLWINTDCGERTAAALDARLRRLAERTGRRVVLVGQSRGGQ